MLGQEGFPWLLMGYITCFWLCMLQLKQLPCIGWQALHRVKPSSSESDFFVGFCLLGINIWSVTILWKQPFLEMKISSSLAGFAWLYRLNWLPSGFTQFKLQSRVDDKCCNRRHLLWYICIGFEALIMANVSLAVQKHISLIKQYKEKAV